MQTFGAWLVNLHPNGIRPGIPAKILDIKIVETSTKLLPQPCFEVQYDNDPLMGYIPVDDYVKGYCTLVDEKTARSAKECMALHHEYLKSFD